MTEAGPVVASAGLSSDEARTRLREHGPNEVPRPRGVSVAVRVARQLRDPMPGWPPR